MALSIRGLPKYRRNILPAVQLKGERVIDVATGIPKYTQECVAYRGGYTTRRRGPDIDPKTLGPTQGGSS